MDPPKCPNCSMPANVDEVRREALRRRSTFSTKQYGLRCTNCRVVLSVRRGRVLAADMVLILAVFAVPIAGAIFGWLASHQPLVWMAYGAAFLLAAFVHLRWVPLLARLERAGPGDGVVVEEEQRAETLANDPEYQAEIKELDDTLAWRDEANSRSRRPWRCAACGEDNPANFDVCWNCEKPNPPDSAGDRAR